MTYLVPVVALLLGVLVLDEPASLALPIGALLILAGVALTRARSRVAPSPSRSVAALISFIIKGALRAPPALGPALPLRSRRPSAGEHMSTQMLNGPPSGRALFSGAYAVMRGNFRHNPDDWDT